MRFSPFREVPPRATFVVVVLALAASVVTGAPWTSSPQPAVQPVARSTAPEAHAALEPLNLASLQRPKIAGTVPDLFASPATQALVVVPAPVAAPAQLQAPLPPSPPPAPVLPALPFRYLGRLSDGERTVVFLASGQNLYSAGVGDTLDSTYRVEAISEAAVTFQHLPLGAAQTLAIAATR